MRFAGIIPARYASSRFPGKPLALIDEKPMLQHVYEHVQASSLDLVVVATDHPLIQECVDGFGGQVVMTAASHPSGTDRCGEAASLLQLNEEDVIINIQGDEPAISPKEIELIKQLFTDEQVDIATLVKPISDPTLVENPNCVKAVLAYNHKVLYFSRYAIPYRRDSRLEPTTYYQHIGIYAYRYKILKELVQLPPSTLEATEKLEQLRWLQHGYSIYAAECDYHGIGIDTPEDLERYQAQHPTP